MPLLPLPLRDRARRALRRRRRPLAAALAATGVLLALASLRTPPAAPSASVAVASAAGALQAGEVAVPIVLPSPVLTSALSVGDVIDVIGTGDSGAPQVLASQARVLEIPQGSSGFGGTSSSLIVVAADAADGLAVTTAAAAGPVSFLIRDRLSGG